MDGKVNRPSPAADVNWQGLEDLYSVNGSVYEYRRNYTLSLVDWTHYLKDVDRVFALLNSRGEQKKTSKTTTARSDGFLAASAELSVPVETASAEAEEDPSPMVGEAPHLTLPADLRTLPVNQPTFSPETKLEWNNDLPEASRLNSEHWRNHETETWREPEERNHLETEFSGNGLSELVLPPGPRMLPGSGSRQPRAPPRGAGPGRDVFEDQRHPPAHAGADAAHQPPSPAAGEQPTSSSSESGRASKAKTRKTGSLRSLEGSAAFPLSSH